MHMASRVLSLLLLFTCLGACDRPFYFSIAGTLTDAASLAPVAGIKVQCQMQRKQLRTTVYSDAEGQYTCTIRDDGFVGNDGIEYIEINFTDVDDAANGGFFQQQWQGVEVHEDETYRLNLVLF